MRLVVLMIFASSCTTAADHVVSGTYLTNFDGVVVNERDGSTESVVEVTAHDEAGGMLDDGFFHSESVSGPFSVTVPDGSIDVRVLLKSQTTDGNDQHIEYQIDGPIEHDVDLGVVDLE
ncbi:MAG: hypothetical protein ABI467_12535 [Kofleriaceae bacterium]